MDVRDIMTGDLDICTPDSNLRDVALLMAQDDIGSVPIVDSRQSMKPVGIITDRDITCRLVAQGINPLEKMARDAMSDRVVTARPDMSIEQCLDLMERNQIRRIPVVDKSGRLCGIIAQADIAKKLDSEKTAELVRDVSQPNDLQQYQSGALH